LPIELTMKWPVLLAFTALWVATPAAFAQGTPTAAVENTMAQRMQACVVCHGKEGRATNAGYFPRIAGKPQGYLYNQLKNFQEGRRRNQAMNHLVQHMSDDYLRDIARYFADLDLPYPPGQRPDSRRSAGGRDAGHEGQPGTEDSRLRLVPW
jgi:cytochrome c553